MVSNMMSAFSDDSANIIRSSIIILVPLCLRSIFSANIASHIVFRSCIMHTNVAAELRRPNGIATHLYFLPCGPLKAVFSMLSNAMRIW